MNPLTLNDLSGNAFRILGLSASASQADIDSAARKMRIWPDPAMIPRSVNDAQWIGPVPRTRQNIENAVARLTDPLSRLEERFWWFCLTPPGSDIPLGAVPTDVAAVHDSALIHLYRSLVTDAADENPTAWQALIEQFRALAASDDYLQWLFEVESTGDFEKRASLEEIAEPQRRLPLRLSTAVVGSIGAAVASGDFAAAGQAIQLVRADSSSTADALLDRMEDDLAGRCNELVAKIDAAWKTRLVSALRPACNHAIARFGTTIQPLIDEFVSMTPDVDRQNRARMHGINLLIHTSEAYGAIDNFLASERTLETALELAADTPMQPEITDLLDKVKEAALRQRAGAPRGHRRQTSEKKEFKVKPGGAMKDESWLSAISMRWILVFVAFALGVARLSCSFSNNTSSPPGSIPRYDSSHPPPVGR
jgi:hypothetical protein